MRKSYQPALKWPIKRKDKCHATPMVGKYGYEGSIAEDLTIEVDRISYLHIASIFEVSN